MCKVSIIVPAYNAEKTLKKSIYTLMNQSYEDIEIIIVNDGSKDRTESIAESIAKNDSRVRVISIENGGVSNARNIGIENSNGEFVAFMDSDDTMDSNMIEQLVSQFDDNIDLVSCGHKVVNNLGKVLFSQEPLNMKCSKKEYYQAIENLKNFNCFNNIWNKMFRTSIIIDNGIRMDTSISMGEDYLFVMDYLKHCINNVVVISQSLYYYTLSKGGLQASFKRNEQLRLEQLGSLKRLYNSGGYPLNGYYLEVMRTYYILMIESEKLDKTIDFIFQTDECRELLKMDINCDAKYRLFLKLINTHNTTIILLAIKTFKTIKTILGKSYNW